VEVEAYRQLGRVAPPPEEPKPPKKKRGRPKGKSVKPAQTEKKKRGRPKGAKGRSGTAKKKKKDVAGDEPVQLAPPPEEPKPPKKKRSRPKGKSVKPAQTEKKKRGRPKGAKGRSGTAKKKKEDVAGDEPVQLAQASKKKPAKKKKAARELDEEEEEEEEEEDDDDSDSDYHDDSDDDDDDDDDDDEQVKKKPSVKRGRSPGASVQVQKRKAALKRKPDAIDQNASAPAFESALTESAVVKGSLVVVSAIYDDGNGGELPGIGVSEVCVEPTQDKDGFWVIQVKSFAPAVLSTLRATVSGRWSAPAVDACIEQMWLSSVVATFEFLNKGWLPEFVRGAIREQLFYKKMQ
jgi:hypothetical protein